MMTRARNLDELYQMHTEGQLSEKQCISEAQRLFPYTWRAIFTLMNQPLKMERY